jgi:hypothetical protein
MRYAIFLTFESERAAPYALDVLRTGLDAAWVVGTFEYLCRRMNTSEYDVIIWAASTRFDELIQFDGLITCIINPQSSNFRVNVGKRFITWSVLVNPKPAMRQVIQKSVLLFKISNVD